MRSDGNYNNKGGCILLFSICIVCFATFIVALVFCPIAIALLLTIPACISIQIGAKNSELFFVWSGVFVLIVCILTLLLHFIK